MPAGHGRIDLAEIALDCVAEAAQAIGTESMQLVCGVIAIDLADSYGWLGRAAHAVRVNAILLRWSIRPTIYSYAYPSSYAADFTP
jgi:hypothetical protein